MCVQFILSSLFINTLNNNMISIFPYTCCHVHDRTYAIRYKFVLSYSRVVNLILEYDTPTFHINVHVVKQRLVFYFLLVHIAFN